MATKKIGKKAKNVKILADGTKRVVLMFPGGISLRAKKQVPYAALAKILGVDETNMVEGQSCHVTAIGAVRG